ncbi:hypothetical protein TNCV_3336781 [Trichonephila clavipes]|nr:hypothetical protein TNCV_3336781 [Trichonephila clavipes]
MRAMPFSADPSLRDHWALRCMSRCPDQVVNLKRDLQCLSPQASMVLIYRPIAVGMKEQLRVGQRRRFEHILLPDLGRHLKECLNCFLPFLLIRNERVGRQYKVNEALFLNGKWQHDRQGSQKKKHQSGCLTVSDRGPRNLSRRRASWLHLSLAVALNIMQMPVRFGSVPLQFRGRTPWGWSAPYLFSPSTNLVTRPLFKVPLCRKGTIHLQASMPSPGFV